VPVAIKIQTLTRRDKHLLAACGWIVLCAYMFALLHACSSWLVSNDELYAKLYKNGFEFVTTTAEVFHLLGKTWSSALGVLVGFLLIVTFLLVKSVNASERNPESD